MQPTTKGELIGYLAGLEVLAIGRAARLKKCIDEGESDHQIEEAAAATVDCAQRIEKAKKALAKLS